MTLEEQQQFTNKFLEIYLSQGFGSLPKSEIDLLVFYLLMQTGEYQGKNNYQLANLLKIPEARVKNFRLNSTLKYQEIDSKAILENVVTRFVNSEQYTEFGAGKIELSLEDPIEKREIENFLKVRGYHAEYQLNTEVLKISPLRLFELIIENTENPEIAFNEIVRASFNENQETADLLNDALTLKQKFLELRKQLLDPAMLKTLVGAAVGVL